MTDPTAPERSADDNVPSQEEIEALRAAKGKAIATEQAEDSDDEDAELDFQGDEEDESDEEGDNDEDEEDEEDVEEDVEGAEAGSSKAVSRKRERTEGDEDPEIIAGLSGDEVDPDLIIPGGRASRRGRRAAGNGTGNSKPKYQAKAALESDEDEW